MVLCQKEIHVVTDTTKLEIWERTDQICKLLIKNNLNYSTLDIADENDKDIIDEIVELEKLKNNNIALPFFSIDGKIIGDNATLYNLTQNKKIIGMARYYT